MNRRRSFLALLLAGVAALGVASLVTGPDAVAAPPCPGSGIHCLDYWDPVYCLKPGEGWRVYSNACYAAQDCARRCEPA